MRSRSAVLAQDTPVAHTHPRRHGPVPPTPCTARLVARVSAPAQAAPTRSRCRRGLALMRPTQSVGPPDRPPVYRAPPQATPWSSRPCPAQATCSRRVQATCTSSLDSQGLRRRWIHGPASTAPCTLSCAVDCKIKTGQGAAGLGVWPALRGRGQERGTRSRWWGHVWAGRSGPGRGACAAGPGAGEGHLFEVVGPRPGRRRKFVRLIQARVTAA